MSSAVDKPPYKSCSCRISKLRRFVRSNKVCRMKRKKLRNVSVTDLDLVVIDSPFLYLPVLAYLRLRELFYHAPELFSKGFVLSEYLRSLYYIAEKNRDYLRIH